MSDTTRKILVEVEVTEGRIGANRGSAFDRAVQSWLDSIKQTHCRSDPNWTQYRIIGWSEKES